MDAMDSTEPNAEQEEMMVFDPDDVEVEISGTRYPFPVNFDFWESRWVKELTSFDGGYLTVGQLLAASMRGDPDSTLVYAAIALLRAPGNTLTPTQIQQILDKKKLGEVRLIPKATADVPLAGDGSGDAPAEPSTPPASTPSTTETPEPTGVPV